MILRNLVENAHRYSPEGSTIRVSVKAGLMPVMAVEDEGPGIDEAKSGELSKAFVPHGQSLRRHWPRTEHRHAHRSAA
ncbi:sensor protein BasS/PmrB [Klebsiella pneumoniae]|uniref:Sensor protein BasS/PmrB n=1 Tax=Klebsiella pneumoniae TaxID=573 RepID=A0A447S3V0_KLEPN|nr:sensor protein BasS/PmrB [Klebsiella pneumoniae]